MGIISAGMSHYPDRTFFYLKRTLGFILLLAVACVFLYSAYSKIFSGFHFSKSFFSSKDNFFADAFTIDNDAFDAFRWKFLDFGFNSITLAGAAARLVIGMELVIGFFLLFHIFLRRFTYPLVIGVLTFFSLYLVYQIILHGNTGDCGCFGSKVEMTPIVAIWKNVLLIIATFLLMYIYPAKPYKGQEWISIFIGMVALVIPFVVLPLRGDIEPLTVVNEPIDLEPLYATTPIPGVELRKGKHIIAFMSLTCRHCRKAAYLLQTIQHENPSFPIFLILSGHPDQQKEFFKESHAEAVPHMLFTNATQFTDYTKYPTNENDKPKGVPAIYWINNSFIESKSTYYQLDPKEMAEWLKK